MSKGPEIREILERHDVFSRLGHTQLGREQMLTKLVGELSRLMPAPADDPVDEFNDAVSTLVQRLENGMVTKWIVVIDSIAADGGRGLWCQSSRDQHAHESLGMLAFTEAMVKAKIYRECAEDPE